MEELLQQILQECRPYTGQGALASYIPELARQDPDRLGIAVFHKDGNMVEGGGPEEWGGRAPPAAASPSRAS